MTEREKLIKLLDDGCYKACSDASGKKVNEVLADYLLANGVNVSPIKVGQSIWTAEPFKDNVIREGWITVIMINKNGFCGFWVDFGEIPLSAEYMDIDVGETVFLTREEAEKEIERRTAQNGLAYATPNFELQER